MPTYQSGTNTLVAIKREGTFGTAAGTSDGLQLRITDSPGSPLMRAVIQSAERRTDRLKPMGRLGGKMVDGTYNGELSVGGAIDSLFEAIMRGTWTAAVVITEATASLASITTTTSTIVASAGSWITAGVRVGDVVTLTNHATAANNNLRLRVVSVAALTITVAGTPLTADAVADNAFTLTILKKLKSPTTPTSYSYTVEENDTDIDLSVILLGHRLVGLQLSFKPGQHATYVATFKGVDRTVLATGTSPYFVSPTVTTGLSLVADDSSIRYNGAEVVHFTGFDLNFQIASGAPKVIGTFVSPTVFDNDLTVTASITALRSDFANLTLFDAETEFEMSILLREPESAPVDCLGFYFPRVKISELSAPVQGGDEGKVETLNLMIGPKVAATGYDAGICSIFSSAA
jgi:hypothetical protein